MKFVVPAERTVARLAQRGISRGNYKHLLPRRFAQGKRGTRWGKLFPSREIVQHIGESLRVHLAVLDYHLSPVSGSFFPQYVNFLPAPQIVSPGPLRSRRPVAGRVGRQLAGVRIDAALKQVVERGMKRRRIQAPACQVVPVESFEVTEIKDNTMPFRNRTVVECLRIQKMKELIGLATRGYKLLMEVGGESHSWQV